MELNPNRLSVEGRARQLDRRPQRRDQVDRLERSPGTGRRVLGQRVERLRKAHQAVDLFVERLELFSARCDHAVAERLEVTLKVGQWRAQLMRGVDDELAPHLLLLLQA